MGLSRPFLLLLFSVALTFALQCNIKDYGARGDGRTLDTLAIQKAVNACSPTPNDAGGVVYFPPGTFLSGSLTLGSNLTLWIDSGATLLGSTNYSDYMLADAFPSYPIDSSKNTQPRFMSLLSGNGTFNVTITGGGEIDGQGVKWSHLADLPPYRKPSLIEFLYSNWITIRNVTVLNSPFYNIHPYASSNILIDSISLHDSVEISHNDGIDPDSCVNVTIQNSTIFTLDDNISLKSGAGAQGVQFGRPTQNVVIQNNFFPSGAGVAIGSEISGGVSNVSVANNRFGATNNLLRFKSCPYYGGSIENVTYQNNVLDAGVEAIFMDQHYECGADNTTLGQSFFRNIHVTNLTGFSTYAGHINCASGGCYNINFTDVVLKGVDVYYPCVNVTGVATNCTPVPCFGK